MLSQWHRDRAKRNEDIEAFTPEEKRIKAVGKDTDFPYDKMCIYMTQQAETLFEPKKIIGPSDWLVSQREGHQTFDWYKAGNGNIKWIKPGKDKISLFLMDNTFSDEQVAKYQMYAQAFFPGTKMGVIKKGDFLTKARIANREGFEAKQYQCCGKDGILQKLPTYKPLDHYAILGVTNNDLYPGPRWNYCFGWASYTEGVGTFSFCRYDPAWDGIDDPDREKNFMMRSCHIMVHEIGHMFGLRHCIYYECLMNGLNSAEEQRQGGIRILCPVCQKKLK